MKQATIDMLAEINHGLLDHHKGVCIMDCYMSKSQSDDRCMEYWGKAGSGNDANNEKRCMDCIADWLNEEWKG